MTDKNLLAGKMMDAIQYGGKIYIYEPDARAMVDAALATNVERNARIADLEAQLAARPEERTIGAEVGKYPINGHELLATLRGIADAEDQGIDKSRRRGAAGACRRCISAVESWLRSLPSPPRETK